MLLVTIIGVLPFSIKMVPRPHYAQMENQQEAVATHAEVTQLTTVVSDGPVQETTDSNSGIVHFYRGVDPFPDQGLKQVLSRKYRLGTYTWSGSDATNALVLAINFPYALMQFPNIQQKVSKFEYFRSPVEIELLIAGTMYQFGTLMAAVVPFFNGNPVDPKTADVYTMSTLDHVLVSPDSSTTTKLKIPYLALPSYIDVDNAGEDVGYFGTLVIRVLNPLREQNSTSTPSIVVSVFASFADPEVMGPTLHDAQSGNGEQKAKSSSGILSKTLERASGWTSKLSVIPAVAPYAAAGSLLLGGGAKLARFFGLDKPNSISAFNPVFQSSTNGMSVGNGMNTLQELGLDVENALSNSPQDYATSIPETNIEHLAMQPGLFAMGTFTTTDAAGTVIKKWHVTPSTAYATYDASIFQFSVAHTPCSTIANMFRFWHCDMKYAIFFRCSKFQVAKIRIAWHPSYDEIALTPEGEGDFASQVYDICGDTTVYFSVPYCKNEPYSIVKKPWEDWLTPQEDNYCAGALSLSIVNPVTNVAGTTTMPVYYNIYVATDSNPDFFGPTNPYFDTQEPSLPLVIDLSGAPFTGTQIAQSSGTLNDHTCTPVELFKSSFPSLFVGTRHTFDKVCSGEKTMSVLDLVHRYNQNPNLLELLNGTPQRKRQHIDGFGTDLYALPSEILRYWAWFSRGGTCHKLIPRSSATYLAVSNGTTFVKNVYQDETEQPYCQFGPSGVICEVSQFKPTVEFSTPYYSKFPYNTKSFTHPSLYQIANANQAFTFNGFEITYTAVDVDHLNSPVAWFIAAKDDFTYGYFRGCPRMYQLVPQDP